MKLTRKVLYNRARDVDFDRPSHNQHLVDLMMPFMRANGGIGLAAPQIGMSRRLFVMEIDGRSWNCFNPGYQPLGEESVEMEEGCLSFPGKSCIVSRPRTILASYQNSHGQAVQEVLDGLPARCYQHEHDHLEGITMWDRRQGQHAEQS